MDLDELRVKHIQKELKRLLGVEALACRFESGRLVEIEGVSWRDEEGKWHFRKLTDDEKAKVKAWLEEAGFA